MRRGLLLLTLAGCGASHHVPTVTSASEPPPMLASIDAAVGDADSLDAHTTVAVSAEAGVEAAEIAWLVTHIADDPEPSHGGESQAVRQLASLGPPGVHAVAEVFRVGDPRRVPFARRVIERVALSHCHRDRGRAGVTIVHLQGGPGAMLPPPDAGIIWSGLDNTQWSGEAVARLHHWADSGLACEATDGGAPSVDD